MLSTAAFNALLKTLEEPPSHVVFILATTEPQKLPATILSRVQRYDFGRIPAELMVQRMREAIDDMQMTADDEALRIVARAAEGAMRDAFSILDMCVAGAENGHIAAAQVRDALGTSDRDFLFSFMDAIADRDAGEALRKVDALMRSGREPQVFLKEMSGHCRMLLTVLAVKEDAASLLDITPEDEKSYREQASRFSQQRLLRILDGFTRAEGELRFASTPRIGLESAALHACEEAVGEDNTALIERLGELEAKLKALEGDIAAGRLTVATDAKPNPKKAPAAAKAAPAQADAPAPAPAKKAVPSDAKGVWDATLKLLSKNAPPLFGLLRNERFMGVEDGVYRVAIPQAKKDFSYVKLSQPSWKEKINQALTEAAGTAARFEPFLEQDNQKQASTALDSVQQSLIEAFGRETVQIDEGGA